MRSNWTMDRLQPLRGKDVYTTDGQKVGSVQDIYYDESSSTPEWIGLGTGFFGMKRRVVPVETMQPEGEKIVVPCTKDKIENEPDFDLKDGISTDEERMLCDYFSLGSYSEHSPRILRADEQYRSGF